MNPTEYKDELDTPCLILDMDLLEKNLCMDTEYLNIGCADHINKVTSSSPPLRLLTTVISANQAGFVTVDAGLKALYQHGGLPQIVGSVNSGLRYDWFGDEYGKISSSNNGDLPDVGTVLEMIVPHCDPTVNLFDKFYLIRHGQVIGSWNIDLRGGCQ